MNGVMKIVKSHKESGLLIKGISKTIKNEAKKKQKKRVFLGMLLGTLGASLIWNLLTVRRTIRAGKGTIGASESTIFNVTWSFNKFWTTKVLSKWT